VVAYGKNITKRISTKRVVADKKKRERSRYLEKKAGIVLFR
jgi:hypothetical protein